MRKKQEQSSSSLNQFNDISTVLNNPLEQLDINQTSIIENEVKMQQGNENQNQNYSNANTNVENNKNEIGQDNENQMEQYQSTIIDPQPLKCTQQNPTAQNYNIGLKEEQKQNQDEIGIEIEDFDVCYEENTEVIDEVGFNPEDVPTLKIGNSTIFSSYPNCPKWKLIDKGLNIRGKCLNNNCIAQNQYIYVCYGYGKFQLGEINYDTPCSQCQAILDEIDNVYFYKCKWKFEGKIQQQKEKYIKEGVSNSDTFYSINDWATKNWNYLSVITEYNN